MGKVGLISLLYLSLCLVLSGCWDRKEVNDLAIIVGAAIDEGKEDPILLTLLFMVTSGGTAGSSMGSQSNETQQQEVLMSVEGKTIADAVSKMQEKLSRRIFWGHNRVIIFGEKLAKKGIKEHIDFFVRHPETRLRAFTFISKGEAHTLLETDPVLEESRAEMLRELMELDIAIKVPIKELMSLLSKEGENAVIPWIETAELTPEKPEKGYRLNGLAVISNGKMIDKLTQKESRGLMWIQDKIEQATITVQPNEEEKPVTMIHLHAKTDLKAKVENGEPIVYLKIHTEDDVLQNASKINLLDEKAVKDLEKQVAQEISSYIDLVLNRVQKELQVDALGFSDAFLRADPKWWKSVEKEWDEIFPTIKVEKDIIVFVRRQGMVTEPSGIPKEELKEK
jgi:spore germination protein KC